MNNRSNYSSTQQLNKRPSRTQQPRQMDRNIREFEDEDDDAFEDPAVDLDESDDDDEDYSVAHHRGGIQKSYPIRHPKKRRLDNFNSDYELPPQRGSGAPSRNILSEWDEHATFMLLEIWGERFVQLGRSSLRSDDWVEVAERVSEAIGCNFSVSDCRNRLNTLKNKYKKEKSKLESIGGGNSKWAYFKKMDMLMKVSPRQHQRQQQSVLACGVDSGEFVFMNPKVYLDCSNALDEMRDSPGNSESEEEDEDEGDHGDDEESYKMLSDSIKKVGEIYEKIETSKREHMMELERMRMEFQKDLELQKKELIERAREEIAKMVEYEDDGDTDCSEESGSD